MPGLQNGITVSPVHNGMSTTNGASRCARELPPQSWRCYRVGSKGVQEARSILRPSVRLSFEDDGLPKRASRHFSSVP